MTWGVPQRGRMSVGPPTQMYKFGLVKNVVVADGRGYGAGWMTSRSHNKTPDHYDSFQMRVMECSGRNPPRLLVRT